MDVTLPSAASVCVAFLPSHARTTAALLVVLVALGCSVLLAALYPQVTDEAVLRTVLVWASPR
jgi:multicomponent K+:H+ antiporter subunit A